MRTDEIIEKYFGLKVFVKGICSIFLLLVFLGVMSIFTKENKLEIIITPIVNTDNCFLSFIQVILEIYALILLMGNLVGLTVYIVRNYRDNKIVKDKIKRSDVYYKGTLCDVDKYRNGYIYLNPHDDLYNIRKIEKYSEKLELGLVDIIEKDGKDKLLL